MTPQILVAEDQADIRDLIALNLRQAGYDVFLVLEATIGFNKRDSEESEDSGNKRPVRRSDLPSGELNLTPRDTEFLKLLRISFDNEKNRS